MPCIDSRRTPGQFHKESQREQDSTQNLAGGLHIARTQAPPLRSALNLRLSHRGWTLHSYSLEASHALKCHIQTAKHPHTHVLKSLAYLTHTAQSKG